MTPTIQVEMVIMQAYLRTSIFPVFITVGLIIPLTTGSCSSGKCSATFSFTIGRNMVDGHALLGHVFANVSVAGVLDCYKACQPNCRCISFNFLTNVNQDNCQLNEEKHLKPSALKAVEGSQYYDLAVTYKMKNQEGASPSPCTQCVNSCCKYHSCLNGGTCRENCEPTGKRFLCDCYAGYTGRLCQTADCVAALGMESGAITNGQVSASSIYTGSFAGYRARLHSPGGCWLSLESDINQWLEIDLITQRYISVTRVATQGGYNDNQWVMKYKLQYRANSTVGFQYYREQGQNTDKVFDGNTGRDTVVSRDLKPAIQARYIRFLPMTWYGWIAMRVELYGCRDCSDALGMESGAISDQQISASSEKDNNHAATRGRLQLRPTPGTAGAWVTNGSDASPWLQIDLINNGTKVTSVATQGRYDSNQLVTKYSLQYGNDSSNFLYYKEQGEITNKEFTGNTDTNTVESHDLDPPITARFIRFRPLTWYGWAAMRVELYGCHGN